MDDRTIIDDDSIRITDPMDAQPGDLLILGNTVGTDFIQKMWVCVKETEKTDSNTTVGVNGYLLKILIPAGANKNSGSVIFISGGNTFGTGLFFDCLIRPFTPTKKGIYVYKNTEFVYFNGKGKYVFLADSAFLRKAPIHDEKQWSFDKNKLSLLWSPDTEISGDM